MRLKRLELFGFKSFADRTVMDFETTLSGIVGPNGCGKSNVVDAVRWVLGETRPTSMRGDEMSDVIFKGSTSRPPLSVAEVTLVLDNAAGIIEDRGGEVSVSRRVFKSGEGEYLIDGIKVRLKDVREMLFDTGLGSRGYSVLEQGRIDAVLSANPVDRRSIFEEAAGISRYRQRRREAESRLGRVESDLLRLDDVVGELEKRSRSLKLQAGKARRFVEARDDWKIEGVKFARHQVYGLDGELEALRKELAELEAREAGMRAERDGADADVAGREREQEALAGEVERLGAQASELAGDVRALDERVVQLGTRITSLETSSAEEAERAAELGGRLEGRRAEVLKSQQELAELEGLALQAAERMTHEENTVRGHQRSYAEARSAVEKLSQTVLEFLHERTSARNAVEHHSQTLGQLDERSERASERCVEAEQTLEGARTGETQALVAVEQAEEALRVGMGRRGEFEREADELEREVTRLDGERGELELQRARLASHIDALLDREREVEGLEAGARAVVEGVKADDGPELLGALRGFVADHLRTTSRTARALDSVLGARAQALVLGERGDAASVLEWLKQREGGLVSLTLPEGLVGASAPRELRSGLAERDGVLGLLRDSVTPSEGFEVLADVLLEGVVLVRDPELALELLAEHPDQRFVTEAGDLFDAGGVVGGHREVAQGPVGRRSHAAELEREADRVEREIQQLSVQLEGVAEQREEKRRGLDDLLEQLSTQRQGLAEAKSEVGGARARLADLEEAFVHFQHEEQTLSEERGQLGAELETSRVALTGAEQRFDAQNASLEQAEATRGQLERRRDELAKNESQAKVEVTRLNEKIEGAQKRLADLELGTQELGQELERTQSLVEDHRRDAEQGRVECEELANKRVELLERRGSVEERLDAMRVRERAGREAIETQRGRRDEVTRELEALLGHSGERRLEEQKCALAREELLRRTEEEFQLLAVDLLKDFEPEDELLKPEGLAELEQRVAQLREQLDTLGPVNLEAVTELEEVSERLSFLTEQRDDLLAGRRNLEATIKTINLESERLFLETFEQIRGHFQVIFRQLFGGGRADVVLDSDVPVLEAGIEINARPPGRETLPISLLSGGQRTMTALALLFAVFRAQPSPFCVLDEVDAALDDANIVRFLGLLDTFLEGTQFIVVTHNKGTMAACDQLYGVTMEVRGVSHVVSVQLSQVDEFVPEARGASGSREPDREPDPESDPEPDPVVEITPQAPPVVEEPGQGAALPTS